jgi:glyoxylase-like metal-dependent hydrolase (beta-lactamase superfamily II)
MTDRIELRRYELGPFMENAYLLIGPSGRKAALFDPGLDSEIIFPVLEERDLELELIVNTHGHVDHVAGNAFFKERTGARLALHPLDLPLLEKLSEQGAHYGFEIPPSPPPDLELQEGVPLLFDGMELDVLHTPGHSPGGACIRFGGRMIVGDTLFLGSVGRTDLPGGSWPELLRSIREKLFRLPEDLVCYPGHGPETTIAAERRSNPFVSDAAAGSILSEPL